MKIFDFDILQTKLLLKEFKSCIKFANIYLVFNTQLYTTCNTSFSYKGFFENKGFMLFILKNTLNTLLFLVFSE